MNWTDSNSINEPIRVVHVTPSIGRQSFGLGQVAVNLTRAENDLNADARIWCLDSEEQIDWAIKLPGLARNNVRSFHRFSPARLGFSLAMLRAAQREGIGVDIVHQHGIWTACSYVSNTFRRKHNIPIVIAPHGSLEHWVLERSQWKKRLSLLTYEYENLHLAACLHATSEAEIADFRDFGLNNAVALIPNGISTPWLDSRGNGARFREQYAIPTDRRLLLFLSRITPKKGLPLLLEAINLIRCQFSDWLLVIAGTDEFEHLQEVESVIVKLDLLNFVKFTGPLYDQNKRDAFAASDAFVLPSHSEGAPMVVLDSLATGVPVITTQGTPWRSLIDWNAGWWEKATVDGMTQALQSMLNLSEEQLRVMGQHGIDLVRTLYLWETQGQKALDLYGWLLGRQAKPDFVITD